MSIDRDRVDSVVTATVLKYGSGIDAIRRLAEKFVEQAEIRRHLGEELEDLYGIEEGNVLDV